MRKSNNLAIASIEQYAKKRVDQANESIQHISNMSNIHSEVINQLKSNIQSNARIGIHFHPYRKSKNGISVIEHLIESGYYKNQFETKISNGSLTAFKGGQRDIWENLLFDKVFEKNNIEISLRPKYGALSLIGHSDGPSPRFGSCYFLSNPRLCKYTTFTYLDSYFNPTEKGTIEIFDDIISSILSESFQRDATLGFKNIRPDKLIQHINKYLSGELDLKFKTPLSRNLDHYIEAQIHTQISLLKDVEILVADKAYQKTEYEKQFIELCKNYHLKLIWNRGLELKTNNVPDNFRGAEMPIIAKEIAINNKINAYSIAKAENKISATSKDESEIKKKNQLLKYLWHTLVKYGEPIE